MTSRYESSSLAWASAELKWASISAFSPRLARLEKGKSARLRASRIREHITMSLSGPVPRSHSPDDFVRSSRVMRGDPWGGAGLAAARLLRTLRRAIASRSRVRSRSRSMAPSRRRATLPTCRVAPWYRCNSGSNPLEKTQ